MTALHHEVLAARGALEDRPALCAVLRADWRDALFIHFRVDAREVQPWVPLELDLFEGNAYVSLVAFTQHRLRPVFGGWLGEWLSKPLGRHEFLNVRTYVRRGDERGIYFLAEWIPNRLAIWVGPRLYGLPYRLGRLNYAMRADGEIRRAVDCAEGRFECRAAVGALAAPAVSTPGSETAFLLERYAAFTSRRGVLRRFRIAHASWLASEVNVAVVANDLPVPVRLGDRASAHYSAGVEDVRIGRPERLTGRLDVASWLPLAALPMVAMAMRNRLPAWALMWALAYALFLGCKWLRYRRAARKVQTTIRRAMAYLVLWPGMDAGRFLDVDRTPTAPRLIDALPGLIKTLCGAALLWGLLPHLPPPAAGHHGMDRHGWPDPRAALWALRRDGVGLAARGGQCGAADESAGAGGGSRGVLGKPVEHRISSACARFALSAASDVAGRRRRAAGDVRGVRNRTRAGDHGAGARGIRGTDGVFCDPGDGGCVRAFGGGCAAWVAPWMARPSVCAGRGDVAGGAAVWAGVCGSGDGAVSSRDEGDPMTTLETLLTVGGICHFGILIASALVPGVLDWKGELSKLAPLCRHVVWTHGAFIVLVIIAFGALTLGNVGRLAAGTPLARWVCGFIAVFWLARVSLQFFLFDARPFLRTAWLKAGYHGLTVVFLYLGCVYGWAAVR